MGRIVGIKVPDGRSSHILLSFLNESKMRNQNLDVRTRGRPREQRVKGKWKICGKSKHSKEKSLDSDWEVCMASDGDTYISCLIAIFIRSKYAKFPASLSPPFASRYDCKSKISWELHKSCFCRLRPPLFFSSYHAYTGLSLRGINGISHEQECDTDSFRCFAVVVLIDLLNEP